MDSVVADHQGTEYLGPYEYQADTADEISNALPHASGLPSVFSVHHNLVSEIWLGIDIDGEN